MSEGRKEGGKEGGGGKGERGREGGEYMHNVMTTPYLKYCHTSQ